MVENTPDPDEEGPEQKSGASLNEALSDLEHILGDQDSRDGDLLDPGAPPLEDPLTQQYTIPLLDDVVLPGTELTEISSPPVKKALHSPASIERDEDCQAVVRRLANEIEIIIQASVDEALRQANIDMAERVKKHIEITLPEILDEIAEIKARKGQ